VLSDFASILSHPGTVGTVHCKESIRAAALLKPGECDWLELRVDNFFGKTESLLEAAAAMRLPRIVTVRHPSEGGAALDVTPAITPAQRRGLYEDFLPLVTLADIELRQAAKMKSVIASARAAGVGIILSHHDFARTPSLKALRELARRARGEGADVFKVAAMANTLGDLARLLDFLGSEKPGMEFAVMGMGRFGKISRLTLAAGGSCLNYGYLGKPNASGQWPAPILKARISELLAGK
jgi:3-dehydroquinate dehydratase I